LGGSRGAEFQECVEGAGELAVVGSFVAVEEIEDAGVVSQVLESGGGAVDRGGGRRLTGHFEFEAGLLEAEYAEMAPTGDGHGFDQGGFGEGAWLEFGDEAGVELLEAVLGLAFEDDGLGQEAVADAVLGGDGFAFFRDRPAGFGAVDAGGIEAALERSYDGRMGRIADADGGARVEGPVGEEDSA
jgi:hypothetical protein